MAVVGRDRHASGGVVPSGAERPSVRSLLSVVMLAEVIVTGL